MSDHRPIHVRLSVDQYAALKHTVSSELEAHPAALLDKSGYLADLDAANIALIAAWKRWKRRKP